MLYIVKTNNELLGTSCAERLVSNIALGDIEIIPESRNQITWI